MMRRLRRILPGASRALASAVPALVALPVLAGARPAVVAQDDADGARAAEELDGDRAVTSAESLGLGGWRPSVRVEVGSPLRLDDGTVLAIEATQGPVPVPLRDRVPLRLVAPTVRPLRGIGLRPPSAFVAPPGSPVPAVDDPGQPLGPAPELGVGAEYALRLDPPSAGHGGRWAYARVLDVDERSVMLELGIAAAEAARIDRDPVSASGRRTDEGIELEWEPGAVPPVETDELTVAVPRAYRVFRRRAGDDEYEAVAVVRGRRFVDTDSPTSGDLLEYAVARVGASGNVAPGTVGATCGVGPSDDGPTAITIGPGARVDLVRLAVTAGAECHVEVGRASPGSIALMPGEGTRFAATQPSKTATSKAGRTDSSWWLPPASSRSFVPKRTVVLRDGVETDFVLPNGVLGRIVVHELDDGRWELGRRLALTGSRLLPRAPLTPPWIDPGPDGSPRLRTGAPADEAGVDARTLQIRIEREAPFGSERWRVHGTAPVASTEVLAVPLFRRDEPTAGEVLAPIARVRLRYVTATGVSSPPGEPATLLAASALPARRAEDLARSLEELDSADFQRRIEARAVLRALGDESRPGLEALTAGEVGPRADAAREILDAIVHGDADRARRATELARSALDHFGRDLPDGADVDLIEWLGPPDPGLVDPDPTRRAHAVRTLIERAERGVERDDLPRARTWLRTVATNDRDEGVRALARFVLDVGPTPRQWSLAPARARWLDEPEEPVLDEPLDLQWTEMPADRLDLAWILEARPELADLDLGMPLARLRAVLLAPHVFVESTRETGAETGGASEVWESRYFDYDARTAELVLRLAERARRLEGESDGRARFLAAASELLAGEALLLEAWREVVDRRMGPGHDSRTDDAATGGRPDPGVGAGPTRQRLVLERADLDLLEGVLAQVPNDDPRAIDIVLPVGDYGDEASTTRYLEVERSDVRLVAAGEDPVVIHAGLRVSKAQRFVLDGVEVRCGSGHAVMAMDGAHVVAVRARLAGSGTVVHAQSATVELVDCEVLPFDEAKPPSTAVRLILGSRLFARSCRLDAGTLFVSSDAEAWLDRCVLDAGIRTLVQSQDGGRLVVRESLLRGEAMGLFRVTRGVLAATVVDVPREPLGRVQGGAQVSELKVSPRLFRLVRQGQTVPPYMCLAREPLGRR